MVQDDGIGFAEAAPMGGYGLPWMRVRVRAFGASLTIENGPTQGTRGCLQPGTVCISSRMGMAI